MSCSVSFSSPQIFKDYFVKLFLLLQQETVSTDGTTQSLREAAVINWSASFLCLLVFSQAAVLSGLFQPPYKILYEE